MEKLLKLTLLNYIMLFLSDSNAYAQYLYSKESISVRGEATLRGQEIGKINPGESFEIIKWNKYNTRVRMSDGKLGWINRSLIENIAPDNETGFLSEPLKMTVTQDSSVQAEAIQTTVSTSNAETQDEVVNTENPADDYASDYDDIKEEAPYKNDTFGNEAISSVLERVSVEAWKAATKRRKVADFCGGGYRSGNRSKCMCAQGTKEAMVASGLCKSYPAGNALETHTQGTIKKSCPNLTLSSSLDIGKAPGGSVIVYSGYAGKRPHNYGHIEIKIPVSETFKKSLGRQGSSLKVGTFLYCSDFCSTKPTKTKTNKVAAIYTF